MGTYYATVTWVGTNASISWNAGALQVFFRGKLIQGGSGTTQTDLRGSVGSYFPYGEDKGSSNPANDSLKFATYTRDAVSGLDYAMNRYYLPGAGRFGSPDPYVRAGCAFDPAVGIALAIQARIRSIAMILMGLKMKTILPAVEGSA